MDEQKLKARALVLSFQMLGLSFILAKYCAKISVNEIIEACEYNQCDSWNTKWWHKVIEEIDTIQ